jgi:molybdate transport system regulatory protein
MQISARNQIIGTIEKISLGAVNAEIQMKLKSGKSIISIITNNSVENLGLAINDEVVAVVKSNNVLLSTTQNNLQINEINSLKGNIEEINIDSVNAEVVVNIGNEDKIVAIVTINSIENMNLKIGASVDVIIKASDIMIGK